MHIVWGLPLLGMMVGLLVRLEKERALFGGLPELVTVTSVFFKEAESVHSITCMCDAVFCTGMM